jgi:hypothetical protein
MTLPELHALLDRLEVKLSIRGDRLHYQAPAGEMTAEIKAALAAHKEVLLANLAGRPEPTPAVAPVNRRWPPRPQEMKTWPAERWRRWSARAKEIQAGGVHWPLCEIQAYEEIKSELGGGFGLNDRDTAAPALESTSATGAAAPMEPWPPRPAELAEWPIPWRKRWGQLANQFKVEGIPFPHCEIEAFRIVKREMEQPGAADPAPPEEMRSQGMLFTTSNAPRGHS